MGKMKYLPAYFTYRQTLSGLSFEQIGRLFMALMQYAEEGTIPELDPLCALAFNFIRLDIDRTNESYEKKCIALQENGTKGGRPKNQTVSEKPNGFEENQMVFEETKETYIKDKDKEKEKEISPNGDIEDGFAVPARAKKKTAPEKRFVPPTPEEVNAYCAEHGYNVDGEAFVDHYQRTGWILKGNVPMKNWQAAVRTWVHYDKERQNSGGRSSGYKPDNNYGDMMAFLNAEIAKGGLDLEQSRDSPDTQSAEDSIPGVLFKDAPF